MKIISGGQTGADRAALDAAMELGLAHGGWIARGRKTEDGPLAAKYRLIELDSARYRDRTEKNIIKSDGTLIVSFGPLSGGSALTEALAIRHDRPCLHLDLEHLTPDRAVTAALQWLEKYSITTLNVAGPRASGEPRIYDAVKEIVLNICRQGRDNA